MLPSSTQIALSQPIQIGKMFFTTTLLALLILPLINALGDSAAAKCTINSLNQTQTVTSPVEINTSPVAPFENVKLSAVNSTAWESYSFEAVSANGTSGSSVIFYRNPSIGAPGSGVVWIEISAVWPNGTQWKVTWSQNESAVLACDISTYGYWTNILKTTRFSFSLPSSLKSAYLDLVDPGVVEGSWNMASITPAISANGMPELNSNGSVELAPLTYWNEAIPMATVDAKVTLSGTDFLIQGFGGHWRNWAPYNWNSLAKDWHRVRAVAGPYSIIFWSFTSATDGLIYTTGFLSQNGTKIFATRNGDPDIKGDSAIFSLSYSGRVRGSYDDNSTGIMVQFVGGGKIWRFYITHTNVLSESPHGSAGDYTSFVNTVFGGDITAAGYDGVAISDQMAIADPAPM
jgi:hypothetical protein